MKKGRFGTYLGQRGNQLTELPPQEIEKLERLSVISLKENPLGFPLGFPPIEVANQGWEAIRNYLAQEVEPLWVAKMIVVGQGRVGKSSLLKRLRDADQRTPDIPFEEIRKQYQPMIADRLYLVDNKTGNGRGDQFNAISDAAAGLKLYQSKNIWRWSELRRRKSG
jgi:hypothetical protein